MKNSKFVLLTFLLGLVLFAFNPQEVAAQSRKELKKQKKQNNSKQVQNQRNNNPQPTRKVVVRNQPIQVAPKGHVIRHGQVDYRYDKGVFYRPQGNTFVAIRPPLGIRVTILPPQYIQISLGNRRLFYSEGVYYDPIDSNNYEVIQPPIGARITQIPPYSEITYLDGNEYYISEGIYYKVVQEVDGSLAYEVVGYV